MLLALYTYLLLYTQCNEGQHKGQSNFASYEGNGLSNVNRLPPPFFKD